MYSDCIQCL